jgi:hypothetical protein
MNINQYISTLPLVETASLPLGTLFWAHNRIYEVIEVDASHSRARVWRGDDKTDVALIPDSTLAHRLRLVSEGRLLPHFRSREEVLFHGEAVYYVFPVKQTALEAAQIDAALCGRQSGLYARRREGRPAFELTNGAVILRAYFYSRTDEGLDTNLADLKPKLERPLTAHTDGPAYWRLLHHWDESPYDLTQTMAFRPVDLSKLLQDTAPSQTYKDDDGEDTTIPTRPAEI